MVSSMMGYGWFLDIEALFHMTDNKSLFITLEEKYLQMRINMGNDEKYTVSGMGMLLFRGNMELSLT